MSTFDNDYITSQLHQKKDLRFRLLRLAEIKNTFYQILVYKSKTEFWISSSIDEKIHIIRELATIVSVIEKTHYSVDQNAVNMLKNKIKQLSAQFQELEKYRLDNYCKSLVDISSFITNTLTLKPSHIVELRILNLDSKLKISKINVVKHILSKDCVNL